MQALGAFATIESAQEFLVLLLQAVCESRKLIANDIASQPAAVTRHLDALRIIIYNLDKLESNLQRSRRILKNLRTLRELLHQDKAAEVNGVQQLD
jgi:hypothetical protein